MLRREKMHATGRPGQPARPAPHTMVLTKQNNDEDGGLILICLGPKESWTRGWPEIRHLG